MSDVQQRAFITGMGIISPAGRGIEQTLETLQGGGSAIGPLTLFTSSREPLPAGEVSDLPEGEWPRTHHLALTAAREAMSRDPGAPDAVILGGTTGGMPRTEELLKAGDREAAHYRLHGIGTVADLVAREVGCIGPALTVSTACSSGAVALKIGLELIRSGRARRVLAGGADALCRLTYYGFGMLKLIDPEGARPLDTNRVGMTVGEAAAMVLLVAGDKKGGSPPEGALAELAGGGLSCDAHHPSAPHPEGLGAVRAMSEALSDAGLAPGDVDYVNLHGTGTIDNDAAESKAMVKLFGGGMPPLSSTKGAVGHSLAAAGAVEAVFCVLGLGHGLIPANTGCREVDPELGLSPVLEPREAELRVVLSNSFGFGGNNASLVLRRPEGGLTSGSRSSKIQLQRLEVLGSACISGAGHTADCEARFREGQPIGGVLDAQEVARDLPRRALRRLKRISRLTLALAAAAQADGGDHEPDKVFYGTGWGALSETHDFLDKLFESDEEFSSPTDFVGSVHNAVAGQVAIRTKAMGANVTATGGDSSFEQALLIASLLLSSDDQRPSLLIGSDEAQPALTPLFDPGAAQGGALSDGGGALLVRPLSASAATTGPTLLPRFFEATAGNPEVIERLLATLGGPSALTETFGAVLCGIPGGSRDLAQEQRSRLLAASGFSGPVIDYRQHTGEYAAASATATVLAVRLASGGMIPAGLAKDEQALDGRGILMLGLGQQVTAIEVGAPRA